MSSLILPALILCIQLAPRIVKHIWTLAQINCGSGVANYGIYDLDVSILMAWKWNGCDLEWTNKHFMHWDKPETIVTLQDMPWNVGGFPGIAWNELRKAHAHVRFL